jgi:hypothetical protein
MKLSRQEKSQSAFESAVDEAGTAVFGALHAVVQTAPVFDDYGNDTEGYTADLNAYADRCSKLNDVLVDLAELHRHLLECEEAARNKA